MSKKILFFFISLFSLFLITNVSAQTSYEVRLIANSVRFRTGNGINHSIIVELAHGSSYPLLEGNKYPDEGGCASGWYKIKVGETEGFVCSEYAEVITLEENTTGTPANDCERALQDEGFPHTYWGKLCALKEKYPTWNFKALQTNLDWNSAVNSESSCGLSYIQSSNEEYIDRSCYNVYGAYSSWQPASQKAVAYYMDPRNFLNERQIFQFEYLKYDSNLSQSYVLGSKSIIQNTEFFKFHSPNGSELSEIINEAGAQTNLNPIFLSSRMFQELGTTTAEYDLYSGQYTGYDGLYYNHYNFFNFGVTDVCANTYGIAYCGLSFANINGWNTPLSAIVGAASMLANDYIAVGQYTTYLQKFNVVPTNLNSLFIHQYMTNVMGPSSEAVYTYNTYESLNLLNSGFTFYIPVYNNMSKTIVNTISGINDKADDIIQRSQADISTIVTSSGYNYSSKYISKIKNHTSIETLKANIESVSGSGSVKIMDASGNQISSGNMATGMKVSISNNNSEEILTVIVKGDTSGDGEINALDLLQVQKNILGTYNLNNEYSLAGDTSGDGTINALDLLQIQKNILGTFDIE